MMRVMLKVTLLIVGLLLVVAVFNIKEVPRLYRAATLFNQSSIVQNFMNMREIFPALDIASDSEPYYFGSRPQALPETFEYKGQQIFSKDFLERSATTALVVLKGEDISHESYFLGTTEQDQRISWSVAKSFLSAMFGIAVADGAIPDINVPVTDYVPSLKGSGYDGVTIKNVLQMSSGVGFDEDYKDLFSDINRMGRVWAFNGSIDAFAASLDKEREQGTYLHYVSIDTHVLGMVLRAATGESISDYFKQRLWNKIQPEAGTYYLTDGLGEPLVLGGLNMRARDYLKFGKLYRDNGRWNGEQVVPERWVRDSVTPDADHLVPGQRDNSEIDLGYGYQWWLPIDADQEFMAIGIYDQYIYVNQKANVVIVKNSANINFTDNNYESANETVAFFRAVANAQK